MKLESTRRRSEGPGVPPHSATAGRPFPEDRTAAIPDAAAVAPHPQPIAFPDDRGCGLSTQPEQPTEASGASGVTGGGCSGNECCRGPGRNCCAIGPRDLTCTLPAGHTGDHIACAPPARHNLAQWPNYNVPAPFAHILDSIAEENLILKDKLAALKKERDAMAVILADIAYPERGSERASWGLSGFTNAIVERWQLRNLLDGVSVDPEREAAANKKIMIASAAPELLAALKNFISVGSEFYDMDMGRAGEKAIDLARQAISKAEGKPYED